MPRHQRQTNLAPRERWSLTMRRQRDSREPWPPIRVGQLWEVCRGEPDFAISPLQVGDKLLISSLVKRSEGIIGNDALLRYPHWVYYTWYGFPSFTSEVLFRQIAQPIY